MPTFEWFFDKLVGQETPLALGFGGMMLAGGLILLFYSVMSKLGVVGSGKADKANEALRADVMRLIGEKALIEADKARFEERCRVQEERLIAMKADYDRDIADEKARTAVFIERVEAIAELEKKLKTGRRG